MIAKKDVIETEQVVTTRVKTPVVVLTLDYDEALFLRALVGDINNGGGLHTIGYKIRESLQDLGFKYIGCSKLLPFDSYNPSHATLSYDTLTRLKDNYTCPKD